MNPEDSAYYAFLPDPARAAAVDRRARAAFAESMMSLLTAFDRQGVLADGRLAGLAAMLDAGMVPPGAVAAYADLVEAIYGSTPEATGVALGALLTALEDEAGTGVRVVTIVDDDLGEGQAERYRRLVNDDPSTPIDVRPLADDDLATAGERLRAGLALLDRAAPAFAGEVRALLRQVVLTRSGGEDPALAFDGASTYMLWGATVLNAERHPTRLAIAEALVHESAHYLLFGFTLGSPLVENDADELYASPLRADPRPMDGIVHASYVLARLCACMRTLAASGALSADEHAEAVRLADAHRRAFSGGRVVIAAHARLTDIGRSAFAPALAYMDGHTGA
ncbi:MAG: hypothetical protein IT561_27885 [Alphaproteobacteria bacterium]|nr:hypothetical protein [Alphaproteobacteria bacterium]